MFTIKYTDQDGYERLTQGEDIRVLRNGKQSDCVSWIDRQANAGCKIDFPTNVYVMNDSGATVAKYVVCSPPK